LHKATCWIIRGARFGWQPADWRRFTVDPRCSIGVLHCPGRYFVRARPPHAVPLTQTRDDAIKDPDTRGVPGQTFVQPDHHHPAAIRALAVELLEFVDELLLVVGWREARKVKAGNVVEVHRVRHRRERRPLIE
jgi:hypothetical protein